MANLSSRRQLTRKRTGQHGEDCACAFLHRLGYSITHRNVQIGHDEIDIIAWDPQERIVVFVEVKTRSTVSPYYGPECNLTYKKRKAMRRAAVRWMLKHRNDNDFRIDAILVIGDQVIDHILDISSWS